MHKILIVDDDATSLAIGRAFLEDEYELMLARSGTQALGALKGDSLPAVVLMDMHMPGMSGIDVLKEMKQDARLRDIPVIFLTGERSVGLEVESYAAGAADLLQKPVNNTLLKLKIRQQMSYVDLARENAALRIRLRLLPRQR